MISQQMDSFHMYALKPFHDFFAGRGGCATETAALTGPTSQVAPLQTQERSSNFQRINRPNRFLIAVFRSVQCRAEPQRAVTGDFGHGQQYPWYYQQQVSKVTESSSRQDGPSYYAAQAYGNEWYHPTTAEGESGAYVSQTCSNGPFYQNQVLNSDQMAQYQSPVSVSAETESFDYLSGNDDSVSSESPHPYEAAQYDYMFEAQPPAPWPTPNLEQFHAGPKRLPQVAQNIHQHSLLSQRASPPRPRIEQEQRARKSLPADFGSELSRPRITRGRTRRPSMFSMRQRMMEVVRIQGDELGLPATYGQQPEVWTAYHQPPTH
jgi:hypothetical protein